jgi:tetratricopeptide (TPR) repeat protein
MNPAAVIDWQSALAVLVVGLAAGSIILWRMRQSAGKPTATQALDQRDLEARRDTLLQQLRELDDTASKRTPEQLARERYALELAAAQAMRDIDRHAPLAGQGAVLASGPAAPAGAPAPERGAMRGFLWGTATATGIGLLLFFVTRAATPREEGGSLTGTAGALSTPEGDAAPMTGSSNEIETRLAQARTNLGKQDLMGVWNDTQFVLQRQPGHPLALSYQALVRLAMGQADVAESMLKRAMESAPDLIDAHLHLAVVYARSGRKAQAESTLRAAMSRFPEHKDNIAMLMQQLSQEPESAPPGAEDAHAGVAPPDDVHATVPMDTADGRPGAAPKMGAASDAGMPARLSGVVELDRSAQGRVSGGGIVFVTVRAVGVTSGPPVAVKRFSASELPGAFAITAADSMMGQELRERVRLEARLDTDGDPMTRVATDPSALIEDVKLGSTGLRLVLK